MRSARSLALVFLLAPLSSALAEDVKPFQAQEVKPAQPREVRRRDSGGIQSFQAEEVKPFQAEEVKPCTPGLERLSANARPDAATVGRWKLTLGGVAYQTEDRVERTRTLHVAPAKVDMGTLSVSADGSYQWTGPGRSQRGVLQPVRPQCGGKDGVSYWAVSDGRETFFFTVSGGGLNLYSAHESFVASGERAR